MCHLTLYTAVYASFYRQTLRLAIGMLMDHTQLN